MATYNGTTGDDSLQGGVEDDTILGGAGNDTLNGGGGGDLVQGGDGNDLMGGQEGADTMEGGAGSDLLTSGDGNDSLDGGDAGDTLRGGAGNDTIWGDNADGSGTGGADTVDAGAGDDVVYGGAGNDTLRGSDGADTIDGGDGDDDIHGDLSSASFQGDDSLLGGAGNDTIEGWYGDDTLLGGTGDDSLQGRYGSDLFVVEDNSGQDIIQGGEDADGSDFDVLQVDTSTGAGITLTGNEEGYALIGGNSASFWDIEQIIGSDANDTVTTWAGSVTEGINVDTGDGDDLITGGDADDTIAGGAGADSITGGAGNDQIDLGISDGVNDTISLADGSGADTITGFVAPSDSDGDGVVDTRGDQFDVSNLTNENGDPVTFYDLLPGGAGSVSGYTDPEQGDGTLLTFPNGETVFLPGVTPDQLDTGRKLYLAGIPCFLRGTMILTDRGEVAIEKLRVGDLVQTRDEGLQPVRWIGARRLSPQELATAPNLRAIRIRAGALGEGLPRADLLVSPQHRILIRSRIARRMFGADEILVAAKQLCQIEGIEMADELNDLTYFHLLFERHQIVISNGAETESLYTGPEALKSVGPAARDEIFALFPDLKQPDHQPQPARPFAPGRMARQLAARHVRNNKPLLM